MNNKFLKENLFILICAAVTFTAILCTAIMYKQNPIQTLPLFISLVVMFLQSRVNRYAYLLGGLNSIIYAISLTLMGLYASAIYSFVGSFPLQIISFINWRKKTENGVTELRRMSWGARGFLLLGFIPVWLAAYYAISAIPGANQSVLDVTATLLGLLVTVLAMLRFSEYAPLNLLCIAITLTTYIMIFLDDKSQITYVIYTVYSFICTVAAIVKMKNKNMVK